MFDLGSIPGIKQLWAKTIGNPGVRVAVLDGPVDRSHPCFDGASLSEHAAYLRQSGDMTGPMAKHGTHVASIIFGRHGGPVAGVAPGCTGLIIPVFSDRRRKLSQLDLSRAIETAVDAGANIINISGGQLTEVGEADRWLEKAIQYCDDNNVLVVAAAGNDGCECLHVPAALPSVLAVGAMGRDGKPLDYSNWGGGYSGHGILAPGDQVLGAEPGGGTARKSGTSMASPVVAGIAALLLSRQLDRGNPPDPRAVRAALLHGSDPCDPQKYGDCSRFLVGKINVTEADKVLAAIERKELPMYEHAQSLESANTEGAGVVTSCGCGGAERSGSAESVESSAGVRGQRAAPADQVDTLPIARPVTPVAVAQRSSGGRGLGQLTTIRQDSSEAIVPSQTSSELTYTFQPGGGLVYALGTLGYDFGTEARRDSFKQLMGSAFPEDHRSPTGPIPHDARDMVLYLKYIAPDRPVDLDHPTYYYLDEAKSLIWTLNLELTPIYALEPLGPFSREVYRLLVDLLDYQTRRINDLEYVEQVSIPGMLAGRAARLFSGQTLPVVELENTRGLYGWKIEAMIQAAIAKINAINAAAGVAAPSEGELRSTLQNFLSRIYYDFRNLGVTSPDRALNFSVTNLVQITTSFADAIAKKKQLDSIQVVKSPMCRLDSDCWDVKLKFFNPANLLEAVEVFRFTLDVSDKMPVTLGTMRTWAQRY